MDPNETLAQLREWVEDVQALGTDPEEREAAELFEALDSWLVNGGFKPDAWDKR